MIARGFFFLLLALLAFLLGWFSFHRKHGPEGKPGDPYYPDVTYKGEQPRFQK